VGAGRCYSSSIMSIVTCLTTFGSVNHYSPLSLLSNTQLFFSLYSLFFLFFTLPDCATPYGLAFAIKHSLFFSIVSLFTLLDG
jgi:hypothetical protein